ncbi:hypothetical protein [uncultured Methylobacterium sp.]|uniref:hypothetical protein n=1 Tax=uncultured Methylobacterium sp. TaxID=157278 RepID=UPI0035CC5329
MARIRSASPEDQSAFARVVAAAREIHEAITRGDVTDQARKRITAEYAPAWVEQCGPDIACRASRMLDRCGPVAFLLPGELAHVALSNDAYCSGLRLLSSSATTSTTAMAFSSSAI